jgi:tetratricopeptide (TPR) repeat protein/NAD-dependent SIR2 family protein deacetylase
MAKDSKHAIARTNDKKMSKELEERIGIKNLLEEKIAIFCGAGISLSSGLPLAKDIRQAILDGTRMENQDIERITSKEFPLEVLIKTIADFVEIEDLVRTFSFASPNKDHILIAELARRGIVKLVLTTNFDDCIEKALELRGLSLGKDYLILYRNEDFEKFDQYSKTDKILIVKLHGSSHDPSSVKATINQVASKSVYKGKRDVIERAFRNGNHGTVVILGYSFSDIFDINPAIETLEYSSKSVVIIDHSKHSGIQIEDVNKQSAKNPFKTFKGFRIKTDTDTFVNSIMELIGSNEFINYVVRPITWTNYAKSFFDLIDKKDPTLNFTLAGECLHMVSELNSAIKYHLKALHTSRNLSLYRNVARSSTHLANCYGALGNMKRAVELHSEALNIATANNAESEKIGARGNLAQDYFRMGEYRIGFELISSNIDLSKKMGNNDMLAFSFNQLGQYYLYTGDVENALTNFVESLELAERLGDLGLQFTNLGNIAGVYRERKDYERSLDYYNKALTMATDVGNIPDIAECNGVIGSIYRLQKNYKSAIDRLEGSRKTASMISDMPEEAYCLKELGSCYCEMGDDDKCISYSQRALEEFQSLNDRDNVARVLGNMGVYYLNHDQDEKAKEYFLEGLRIAESIGSKLTISQLYQNLSEYYRKKGDATITYDHSSKAVNLDR